MGAHLHNYYSALPVIGAVSWFATLLTLLLIWLCSGQPKYASQEGNIAFISDVGADFIKPLFVVGASITAISFVATLASERLLQRKERLLPPQRKAERILSYCAIGGAALGGAALILLSGFDTLRYTTLHRVFLFLFILGVALSAIFTVIEYRMMSHSYSSYKVLQRSYIAKGVIVGILVAMAFTFGGILSSRKAGMLDVAAIFEWIIGFGFNLYLLTFWFDLRLAAPKNELHPELRANSSEAKMNGSA